MREHLNKSLGIEGLIRQSFLIHCQNVPAEYPNLHRPSSPVSLKSAGSRDNSNVEDEMDVDGPMESGEGCDPLLL